MIRRILLPLALVIVVVVVALAFYSRSAALRMEKKWMPDIASLATPHERKMNFILWDKWEGVRQPHWKITYHEEPVTDLRYVDPSITVDLFGNLIDTTSKSLSQ